MPVGNLSIDQALYLLTTHVNLYGNQPINTHRLDGNGELCAQGHACFNGVLVRDVLIWDPESTFLQTTETRAILDRILHHMNWIYDKSGPRPCGGYAHADDVQNAIEVALFKLEKISVKEAKPEISIQVKIKEEA